jgi:hypothetical protein
MRSRKKSRGSKPPLLATFQGLVTKKSPPVLAPRQLLPWPSSPPRNKPSRADPHTTPFSCRGRHPRHSRHPRGIAASTS